MHAFLQIAMFPNKKTNQYNVRKFTINNNNEFVDIKDYYLSKKSYDLLLSKKRSHEYKFFAVYDLNNTPYPTMADIHMLRSDMIGNNYNHYGFAPFAANN